MNKKLKKRVPGLRFSEFEGDWIEKKLSEVSDKISDGIHSTPKYDDNGEYYFINGNNLINTKIEFNESTKRIDKSEYLKYRSELTSQTILISINGTIGNLAFYNNEKIILGKSACYINLKQEENKFFIFCLLQTSSIKSHFSKELTGSTIYNLSLTTIKNTKVLFPSYKEQEKIASFLEAIDTRLTQLRRKHELLQTYKRGVMQKIFSQELRFKDATGSDFPDWEEKKLGDVAKFSKGKGLTKNDLAEFGNLKCIRYAELYTLYDEVIDHVFSSTNIKSKDLVLSVENDVIIPASGESAIEIAKASCVKISGVALGGDLNIIKSSINGEFLAYYLNHHKKKDIANVAQGNTVVHLYSSQLAKIEIEIPEKGEQQKIVNFLTAIDKKLEAVAQQIERSEQFKKGLLQKMFV